MPNSENIELKVLSFNTLASFADKKRHSQLIDFVQKQAPDVAFFAEAYREDGDMAIVKSSVAALHELGYEVTQGSTDCLPLRTDRTGFLGIIRPELGHGAILAAGIRQGYLATIVNDGPGGDVQIGGIHLDDRNETARLAQIAELQHVDGLMGDFNAMDKSTLFAKFIRKFQPIAGLFDEVDPDPYVTTNWLARKVSLAQRVVRMADGRTLSVLADTYGLQDIDPDHHPTIHHLAQIDHIVTTDRIRGADFRVHNEVNLSDHKPLSAVLSIQR